tara:strand:+ start:1539 stop:2396 length:858 start_codon:yes stop_codon:yes gene_type:complete
MKKKSTKKKSTKPKASKIKPRKLIKDTEVAMDFATKIHRKFDHLIKSTILFGSQAKGTSKPGSDIDIVIIIDDAAINWDDKLVAWYREELGKIISAQEYSRDLHINTIKLTTWWNDLMHGDPVVINIIRHGHALVDIGGFFNPIKVLLAQGLIHSTPEAVYNALQRAPKHLMRSKLSQVNSVEGIYWAFVDSAQAALITLGRLAPSPEHITSLLKESFVDKNVLKPELVKWYRDIYDLHKSISHGEIHEIQGVEIDKWQNKAEKFMKRMAEIIDRIIETRKNSPN